MKIGILQCGHAPDLPRANHGDFDAMFIRILAPHGVTFDTYNVVDGIFPSGPNAADAWLLTGSKHGAYEDHAFITPLETLIRDIHASPKRMVGICFGHQIVAQALGGKVEKFAGGWAIGRTRYDFDGLGDIYLNAWHQDQVTQLPKDAKIIARNDFCNHAGLVYCDSILTVQAHPEISPEVTVDYLTMAETDAAYPQDIIAQARNSNASPTDDARVATFLIDFLKTGQTAKFR
ncbi:type 1 glutamine amidotransferase [Pacificibacter sp. AS14]|uniref:type 1 glutamine amidotransferase n=1 Tax=Pacificibacter sp. AS14 TaxID=3135785 RepID=UPI00317D0D8B